MREKTANTGAEAKKTAATPELNRGLKPITIQLSLQMEEALRALLSTGFFGFSIEDAAERILAADLYQRFKSR